MPVESIANCFLCAARATAAVLDSAAGTRHDVNVIRRNSGRRARYAQKSPRRAGDVTSLNFDNEIIARARAQLGFPDASNYSDINARREFDRHIPEEERRGSRGVEAISPAIARLSYRQ